MQRTDEKMENDINYPWLIFFIEGKKYAVNSAVVETIIHLPTDVCEFPDAPDNIRGIFTLRGAVIPLLDLRKTMGIETLVQEYESFKDMLEMRKQDHVRWAQELSRCVESGDEFTLSTDPHKCAFGQWYDHFQTEISSVEHHMKKIDEPHRRLHATAAEALGCERQHDSCRRERCLQTVMSEVEQDLVPRIVGLLDEAKEVFHTSFREMVVVLDDGVRQLGVIVDEVSAVEPLERVEDAQGLEQFGQLDYICGVSRAQAREDGERSEMILMLDTDRLLSMVQH